MVLPFRSFLYLSMAGMLYTLKQLLIAAANFNDFSEKPHNCLTKYAHYFVSCINFA